MLKGSNRVIKTVMPVDSMAGRLSKVKVSKYDPNRYGKKGSYIGFNLSYSAKNFFRVIDKPFNYKTAATSQAALLRQAKFKAVVLSTHERMTDPAKRVVDEAAFALQTKYATFRGYVFKQEWDDYED